MYFGLCKSMQASEFKTCDCYAARIAALRPFPKETLKSLRNYYRIGLTYTSNALEGNSLTESETKVVVEDGLTIGGKPLRDVYEATGHAKAYDFLYTMLNKPTLEECDILTLHQLFYAQIDPEQAGVWRKVRVFISGSRRTLPAPDEVPELMKDFIQWYVANEKRLHPIEFAARVHQQFVYIHPFVDGNGRVARLLMNFALLRAGWTLAIIPPICRHEYIATIECAGKRINDFIRFIRDRVCETQKELLRLLGVSIAIDDRVNGENDRVKSRCDRVKDEDLVECLFERIKTCPGLRTSELAAFIGKSVPTTSRYLKTLKVAQRIVFRGAPKTGGYYPTSS